MSQLDRHICKQSCCGQRIVGKGNWEFFWTPEDDEIELPIWPSRFRYRRFHNAAKRYAWSLDGRYGRTPGRWRIKNLKTGEFPYG